MTQRLKFRRSVPVVPLPVLRSEEERLREHLKERYAWSDKRINDALRDWKTIEDVKDVLGITRK